MNVANAPERLSEKEIRPPGLGFDQRAAYARDIARLLDRRDEFVVTPCPACSSGDALPSFEKDGFAFRRCTGCATIYMSPRPSEAVMGSYYAASENYAHWAKHIFPASEAARRKKIHEPWFATILALCERHDVPLGTLVEVGPGFGTFGAVAQESGKFEKVIVVEPTPELAHACRSRGLQVIEERIEDASASLSAANVLCAFEVIEHLYDPQQFVANCARLIHPGGLMVLSCPNSKGFDIATLGSASSAVDAEHVNLFNPDSLPLMIERQSFKVLEISTPGRLDAEIVHLAAVNGQIDLSDQPFLRTTLVDEFDRVGWAFQQFLVANKMSSHMWVCAVRI